MTLRSAAKTHSAARRWSKALLIDSMPSRHLLPESSRLRQRLVGSNELLSSNLMFSQARFYLRVTALEPGPVRTSNVSQWFSTNKVKYKPQPKPSLSLSQTGPYLLGTAVKFENTYRAIISRQVSVSSRWRFFKLSSAWAIEFSSAEPRLELVMEVWIRLEENVSYWQITLQNACPCHPKRQRDAERPEIHACARSERWPDLKPRASYKQFCISLMLCFTDCHCRKCILAWETEKHFNVHQLTRPSQCSLMLVAHGQVHQANSKRQHHALSSLLYSKGKHPMTCIVPQGKMLPMSHQSGHSRLHFMILWFAFFSVAPLSCIDLIPPNSTAM